MSTYEYIVRGTRYPGVMFVHGVNDIRVPVPQSLKAAARLASATSADRPALTRLEYDSGHAQCSSRAQLQERSTDMWSFFLSQFWRARVPAQALILARHDPPSGGGQFAP